MCQSVYQALLHIPWLYSLQNSRHPIFAYHIAKASWLLSAGGGKVCSPPPRGSRGSRIRSRGWSKDKAMLCSRETVSDLLCSTLLSFSAVVCRCWSIQVICYLPSIHVRLDRYYEVIIRQLLKRTDSPFCFFSMSTWTSPTIIYHKL